MKSILVERVSRRMWPPLALRGLRLLLLGCAVSQTAGWATAADESLEVASAKLFRTTEEIRKLAPAEARAGHPVQLRVFVTAFGRPEAVFGYFVMDDTGPIFVSATRESALSGPALQMGQILMVEGVTDAGTFAPVVREQRRTEVGHTTLPPPVRLTFEQLASGQEDCRYAEIEGIVRATTDDHLTLAIGNGRVDVVCSAHRVEDIARLVDARVRLRGVVSGRFNQKRQWVGVRFNVATTDGITVLREAPADPFGGRTHRIDELLQWDLSKPAGHRVKVRGIVTHFQPGVALFIREGDGGMQVRTKETATLAPGDVVEVLGFARQGTYSAELEDAIYRRIDRTGPPAPVLTSHEELLRGAHDASLVSVRGVLLESVRQQNAETLVMQAGDVVFHAEVVLSNAERAQLPEPGTGLELTGICVVADTWIHGARLHPRTFSLLLRSPADIAVIHQPPWWTTKRLWQALAGISLGAVGILSWVWLLRRQVRAQTAALHEQTQREAVLEERTRIAQELHDTLDQELTGIGLQLKAAAAQLKEHPSHARVDLVHRLLRRSQSEVRRTVWDLRRPVSESGGLVAALEEAAAQLRRDSTAKFRLQVHGEPRALPAPVEHHVLFIATEAMANAFKHARANRVDVEFQFEPRGVQLRVSDDGCGFIADAAPGHAHGHFGLIGMRERSRKIRGQLTLVTAPGEGTRIEVRVADALPLNGHARAVAAP